MHGAFHFKMNEFKGSLAVQVRLYKYLLDPLSRDHRNSQMALNSWKEIATTLGKEDILSEGVEENESLHNSPTSGGAMW